jgi:hypothetical protein
MIREGKTGRRADRAKLTAQNFYSVTFESGVTHRKHKHNNNLRVFKHMINMKSDYVAGATDSVVK